MNPDADPSSRYSLEETTSASPTTSSHPTANPYPTLPRGNGQSQSLVGTFLDDAGDSQSSNKNSTSRHRPRTSSQKLSNELHFRSHVTRDSLVVNLLSSFNQIPDGQGPSSNECLAPNFESRDFTPDPPSSPPLTSDQLHFRGFSGSNTAPAALDSDQRSTPYPDHTSATKSTNSSSKMPHSVDQPVEVPPRTPEKAARSNAGSRPSTAKSAKLEKNKRSKGSKKSAEQNQSPAAKSGQGDAQKQERSSTSFDLNPNDKSRRRSRTNPNSDSILNRSRPVPVQYHDFESPSHSNATKKQASLPRYTSRPIISERESSAAALRPKSKPSTDSSGKAVEATGSGTPLDNGSHRSTAESSARQPLTQTMTKGPSGYATPTSSNNVSKQNTPSESAKGKQSFFRRVFGPSAKGSAQTKPEELPYLLPPIQTVHSLEPRRSKSALSNDSEAVDRSAVKERPNNEASSSRGPPPPIPTEAPVEQPHVIQKKASFFRRRKRAPSISNEPAEVKTGTDAAETSAKRPSVSSLRQVMTPFLNGAIASPTETTYYDSREQQSRDGEGDLSTFHSRTSDPASKAAVLGSDGSTINSASPRIDTNLQPASKVSSNQEGASPSVLNHKSFLYDSSGGITPTEKRSAARLDNSHATESNLAPLPPPITTTSPKILQSSSRSANIETPLVGTAPAQPDIVQSTVRLIPSDDVDTGDVSKNNQTSPTAIDDSPRRKRIWLHPDTEPNTSASTSRMASVSSVPSHELPVSGSPLTSPIDGGSRSTSVAADSTVDSTAPTLDDVTRAKQLFDGYGDLSTQKKASLLLGQVGIASDKLREAYMSLFDFGGLNILVALRDLCGRLALKGETQQVDRILTAFSQRWVDCNPSHGFKNQDVVHTMCYSLLLLNTDLHIADLDQKMTRSQFIRNTLETIRQAANDESSESNSLLRADHASQRSYIPRRDTRSPSPASTRPSIDTRTADGRLSVRPPARPISEVPSVSSPGPYDARVTEASDLLVSVPFDGASVRGWEAQLEVVLKEFYISIRQLRLPLYGAADVQVHEQASNSNLSVANAVIRRASVLSKAPSEGARRGADFHTWNLRNRSKPRLYTSSAYGSSRTSFEEGSVFSQNASSTWSKSFGRAPTSMSSDSIASHFTNADYGFQQSIGFANALSHAIIREEDGAAASIDEENATPNLMDDETLELEGAPWAKEGIVQHKHHMESAERKAKDRNWSQCFAVVEKGCIRLFSFNSKASIRSQKNRSLKGGGVVGGGNWMDSAEALGTFQLRHTLANTLPPPGYSKSRPHVFALVFPTGAVHLFHVGTPEIAKEFVSTANYWSARLSKEPLVGGVSNVEYGWSDNVINTALLSPKPESTLQDSLMSPPSAASAAKRLHSPTPSTSTLPSRPSFQGSLRGGSIELASRARLPGDRAALSEWVPPQQSMSRSDLKERDQLEALKRYVKDVEEELKQHNELRAVLVLTFSPRHPNASKAMSNWERKSSYLLREIVKFRTYIDTLIAAQAERGRVYKERADRLAPPAEAEEEDNKKTASHGVSVDVSAA